MNTRSDTDNRVTRSKAFRLAALMVSFAGVTVAITSFLMLTLVDHFAIKHASKEAQLRLEQLSWQMRDSLDRTLDQAVRDLSLLSSLPAIRIKNDPDLARGVLESMQRTYPDYAWIGIVDVEGKVKAATNRLLEGRDVTGRPWFKAARRTAIAEDYHPATLLGDLLPQAPDPWRFVDVAGPIYNEQGVLRGVLAIHLSWKWARSLARDLLTPALRAYGAQIVVVRGDGVVLLGPDDMLEKRIDTESLRLARLGRTGAVEERWSDGKTYVTGYSQTGRAGERTNLRWSVLVRQTREAAMASAHEFERRAFWLSLVLATLLAAAAALLARRLVQPLKVLSGAIEDIAHDPAAATPGSIPVVGGFHEAQVLSDAMRALLRSEGRHRAELERMNAQLEDTVAERTAELEELLLRDVLTGLPNRRALMQMLPEAMARAARLERPCALMFLDMDGFKAVNDTRGHEEGDALLRQFAQRIQANVRETDLAARLAGDEFVVVLELLNDGAEAQAKAESLLEQLAQPFVLATGTVQVGASIGVALQVPGDAQDPARLLARADQAMYQAKRRGKGRVAVLALAREGAAVH
jgi:diguanylate cyclase (GGDEF)-like protein